MEVKNIILFVIIVILLIIVIRYIMKDVNTLTGLTSGKTSQQIQPEDLASESSRNVPIQRLCNLLISVYGRTLDIYLDGKLVRTCVLPGVAKIDSNAPIYVTPMGGFSGWTSRFQYWSDSSDPQKAWNIYKAGYGGGLLGSVFGKYTVKLSLMTGDTEESTFTF